MKKTVKEVRQLVKSIIQESLSDDRSFVRSLHVIETEDSSMGDANPDVNPSPDFVASNENDEFGDYVDEWWIGELRDPFVSSQSSQEFSPGWYVIMHESSTGSRPVAGPFKNRERAIAVARQLPRGTIFTQPASYKS